MQLAMGPDRRLQGNREDFKKIKYVRGEIKGHRKETTDLCERVTRLEVMINGLREALFGSAGRRAAE